MGVALLPTVDEVLEVADFVTIHLPKTADTLGLINATSLRKMKPTARVVNVARGGIVDEEALADAVRDGVIAGAALDVFANEPTTDSPLFGLPSVIVTPHLGASTDEAQDKAGVQVAEAVNLALAGELVPSAVNVQGGPVDDAVKPFLPLAEKLGRLFTALADEGLAGDVTVEFHGALAEQDCRVVGLSVLKGMLGAVCNEPVTFVNAPLLAEDRGLNLREMSDPHAEDYVSLLRVTGTGRDGEQLAVGGTIFQPGDRERLVEIWNSDVDLEPANHMAFFRYEDRPGVIGAVGGGFGDAGVNIASAQVGRTTIGGTAVMALSLDEAASRATVDAIAQKIGAEQARVVSLG
jgi:D-3-phosphoglycerate dehydrogenase